MVFSDLLASMVVSFGINLWTTVLVFFITFIVVYKCTRRQPGVPPGPPLVPIFGNILQLASGDTFSILRKLRQKYGDVYGLYIGSELTIFLNGYDVIHDALIKKGSTFGNRPTSTYHELVIRENAVIMNNGQQWKELRRFSMNALRELCFKNNGRTIENRILEEAEQLIQKISTISDSFDIDKFVSISVANVIVKVLFGHRFSFDNQGMQQSLRCIAEGAEGFTRRQFLVNCFPFLCSVPGDVLNLKVVHQQYKLVVEFMTPFINEQKEAIKNGEEATTIVGMYIKRQIEEHQSFAENDVFKDETLNCLCNDFFGAGSETSASAIRWIISHLIRQPHIQDKMYSEICGKLGKYERPSLADRQKLVYVEAVIMEGMRMQIVAPLSAPHAVTHDITFHGMLIPKQSTVMINLESVLKDPNVWDNADEFIPERFLNKDETELVVPREFIPFSLGLRSCLGESLARMEIFLFLVSIVQAFELKPDVDGRMPDLTGRLGLTYAPLPFMMSVKKRE